MFIEYQRSGEEEHTINGTLQSLNLAGVPSLHSNDLKGLLAEDAAHSPLQVLVLNNTNIDDTAAVSISSCTALQVLELGATKVTSKLGQSCVGSIAEYVHRDYRCWIIHHFGCMSAIGAVEPDELSRDRDCTEAQLF